MSTPHPVTGPLTGASTRRAPRLWEAATERARLTVVPAGRTRVPRTRFVVVVMLVLVTGVVGLLMFNTSLQQASFTTTALEDKAERLAARQQTLTMQIEDLRNPQQVALRARRLGMVASAPVFLRLSDGAVLGEPTPARPEDAMQILPPPRRKPAELNPRDRVVWQRADAPATSPDSAAETGRKNRTPDTARESRGSQG